MATHSAPHITKVPFVLTTGAEERAQHRKGLTRNHGDLSLDLQNPHKSLQTPTHLKSQHSYEMMGGKTEFLEICQPASLGYTGADKRSDLKLMESMGPRGGGELSSDLHTWHSTHAQTQGTQTQFSFVF